MDIDESRNRYKRLSLAGESTLSVVSLHSTSLEICEMVYGEHSTSYDAVERFYEASAISTDRYAHSVSSRNYKLRASWIYNSFRYENPLVTTTSRTMLTDILRISRQLSVINVPRPLAVVYSFFRLQVPDYLSSPWIHALRAWTEIDDICETESFDGHRKTIVEHTLNVLVFPSIHSDSGTPAARFSHSTESAPPTPGSQIPSSHPIHPSLPIPGTSLTVPSPFHLKLRIITRFSFNEQGRITHHRDFWDVKDVMGLVPGVSLAQWIGTRLTARGLSYASRAWFKTSGVQASSTENDAEIRELENGYGPSSSPAADYAKSTQKAFADSVVRNE
ncbi:hypothetical protein F5879DRAFT_804027 [Lentinula edodes]|uniref:uncharacterized protein n=1 Tax=Lentinula edodes TaxID=5353 RepID=UPI001E8E6D54|nr:uncharacterized protein C8R40DRAFT_1042905 [Lentinula edodes]KAH7876459.1 hypothetical protein C8R40DRAFT_1042905 [Lentinula edodes]KAJ3903237.1 hypothetical protein F5879DRAFT_804027 [Lentinula edodes]